MLNSLEEDTTKKLWEKFGNLYQSKYLVNKFFLWKSVCLLRMGEGESITKDMNALKIVISQLLSMDIKIIEEKCISICSLLDS